MNRLMPTETSTRFHDIYRNTDAWQLHVYEDEAFGRTCWSGSQASLLAATFRTEDGGRAALAQVHPDIRAWLYNPARHITVPCELIAEQCRTSGHIATSIYYTYAYCLDAARTPARLDIGPAGDQLQVEIAAGPKDCLLYKYEDQAVVRVKCTHVATGSTAIFWLDDFISINGSVSRSRFAKNFQALHALYQRLKGRTDPSTLLDLVAERFAPVVIGLRQRVTRHRATSASDWRLRGMYNSHIAADGRVVSAVDADLPPGDPPTEALVAELEQSFPAAMRGPARDEFIKNIARFGRPDRPHACVCDGTLGSHRAHSDNGSPDSQAGAELAVTLQFPCSCRLVAWQKLVRLGLYVHPYSVAGQDSIARAVNAGLLADHKEKA